MLLIGSIEDAASVSDDDLLRVDFASILETYKRKRVIDSKGILFTVLLRVMERERSGEHFDVPWIVENIGSPEFVIPDYLVGEVDKCDLFYVFSNEWVGWIQVEANEFQRFGSLLYPDFERDVMPHAHKVTSVNELAALLRFADGRPP